MSDTMRDKCIEAAALALCDNADGRLLAEQTEAPSFDESEQHVRIYWLAVAEAALDAILTILREPSKEMIDAGITAAETVEDWSRDTDGSYRCDTSSDMPRPVWQAMIDTLNPDKRGVGE